MGREHSRRCPEGEAFPVPTPSSPFIRVVSKKDPDSERGRGNGGRPPRPVPGYTCSKNPVEPPWIAEETVSQPGPPNQHRSPGPPGLTMNRMNRSGERRSDVRAKIDEDHAVETFKRIAESRRHAHASTKP